MFFPLDGKASETQKKVSKWFGPEGLRNTWGTWIVNIWKSIESKTVRARGRGCCFQTAGF